MAILTGEGVGAVAVLRVWGDNAGRVVSSVFRPASARRFAPETLGKPCLGRIGRGLGDEVIVVATAEDVVEVQCHGGTAAVALVSEALAECGVVADFGVDRYRSPGETRLQRHAREALAHATTLRAAGHLLDQVNGALDRAFDNLLMEIAQCSPKAVTLCDLLLDTSRVGIRLVTGGWRVALAGRPNVGKSCLMNALAGFDRSIVSEAAGTTRDLVTLRTAFDGWPAELIDTAGLRESTDALENAGILLARASQEKADLLVLVLDQSQPLTAEDTGLIAAFPRALVVANKSDLPAAWSRGDVRMISAARGDGIAELSAEIGLRLLPNPPPREAPLLFLPEQVDLITQIRSLLAAGEFTHAAELLRETLERFAV